ncbi:MAG: hypothetical protein EBZ58_12685 [Bacteroidetes bacterium]|nr:hypothetical protein [Bacteroidota bacterium]
MIEEYENWEDNIRKTFIELVNYMDKNADPLETIIDFAWSCGADRFWVNNAKDELKKLREENSKVKEQVKEWSMEVFKANQFAVDQTNEYLELADKLQKTEESLANPVAYARINDKGDLFDLRLHNNPYVDQDTVIPLYRKN